MGEVSLTGHNIKVRTAFSAAAKTYLQAAVLQREVSQRVLERLDYIRLQPARVLDLGAGVGLTTFALRKRFPKSEIIAMDFALPMLQQLNMQAGFWRRPKPVCADAMALPFADNSFELVVSSLTVQWCSDLNTVFSECHRVLKPGGVWLFSSLGPETLYELRESWAAVDDRAHVNNFIDMHDVGDSLQGAGFIDPVVDTEKIVMTYSKIKDLLNDIKDLGANTVVNNNAKPLLGKQRFLRMQKAYDAFKTTSGVYPATYSIVYGLGWAQDKSIAPMEYVPYNRLGV